MRGHGICYDTGFVHKGVSTHEPFDPERVRREMRIIRDDLHCTAVRITGGIPERLTVTASHAAEAGLEVWLCPFVCDIEQDELLDVLAECAEHAERLRTGGAEVVLVTGSELSLFLNGVLPGDTFTERATALAAGTPDSRRALAEVPGTLNEVLGRAVAMVRERFGGRVSYASLPFEGVDWAPFDIVATDAGYRSAEMTAFPEQIRAFVANAGDKPAVITEFGCVSYQGAAARGARGGEIVEWDTDTRPLRLDDDYVRDEREQAGYLCELLTVFDAAGVDTAFAHVFATYHLPHRDGPRADLDLASAGIVRALENGTGQAYPDMPWEPKLAFGALAEHYLRGSK